MENWKISHNHYLADQINPKLRLAYWEGHRDFAYDLVNFVKPKKIVELGSQYGCSLFTFCQSVLENQLPTEIHAIDYWRGDIGAEDTGENVYKLVKKTIEQYFQKIYVKLYAMDFNKAVQLFEDNSIQLLHIDGGHTFDDVDNDFQKWLPKLSENGIVLFHDIYSTIDQGSCDHWKYIKTKYNNWMEFKHSCGIGILFPKDDYWYKKIKNTDFEQRCQQIYAYRAMYEYTDIRYKELCENYEKRYEAIDRQNRMIDERDMEIKSLTNLVKEKDKAIEAGNHMVDERDVEIKALTNLVEEKDKAIKAGSRMVDERDVEIKALTNLVEEKDKAIEAESRMVDERDVEIKALTNLVEEKDKAIEAGSRMVDERDREIEVLQNIVKEKDEIIAETKNLADKKECKLQELVAEDRKWKQLGAKIKIRKKDR